MNFNLLYGWVLPPAPEPSIILGKDITLVLFEKLCTKQKC